MGQVVTLGAKRNTGCFEARDVKVQIYSADPRMIIEEDQWVCVTETLEFGEPCTMYRGLPDTDEGITIPPGGEGMMGPYSYIPREFEVTEENQGHRCLLAKITSDIDSFDEGNRVVAENNNMAQRNIQVTIEPQFIIYNPEPSSADIQIKFHCRNFPIFEAGSRVELITEYHSALESAWQDVPRTEFWIDPVENEIHIKFLGCNVLMPPVTLEGYEMIHARTKLELPISCGLGRYFVDFYEYVNLVLRGGMSFYTDKTLI